MVSEEERRNPAPQVNLLNRVRDVQDILTIGTLADASSNPNSGAPQSDQSARGAVVQMMVTPQRQWPIAAQITGSPSEMSPAKLTRMIELIKKFWFREADFPTKAFGEEATELVPAVVDETRAHRGGPLTDAPRTNTL